MPEVVNLQDAFYIVASGGRTDGPTRALKQGETFGVFDLSGDVRAEAGSKLGLYHAGTRHLSHFELRLASHPPLLLNSHVHEHNDVLTVNGTNPDIRRGDEVVLPKGALHLSRSRYIWRNTCYERIQLLNYARAPIAARIELLVNADFADIFEVRGMMRGRRGERAISVDADALLISYHGLDGVLRTTRVTPSPQVPIVADGVLRAEVKLDPQESWTLDLAVVCDSSARPPTPVRFDEGLAILEAGRRDREERSCRIVASNERLNTWIARSRADLNMLVTETTHGPFPDAGVPWFSTPFGRDGLITAYQLLWVDPSIAEGVLRFLAATQAKTTDDWREAQPGKILHELRSGEMAALNEIPFGRYYGSVDATPLFVMLAGAYLDRTGNATLIDEIWAAIDAGLDWILGAGDVDDDGFIEYEAHGEGGLRNQGWRDSVDAVFHADGRLAEGPIALCEVQAYVFGALCSAATLAKIRGDTSSARELARRAAEVRDKFDKAFWLPELGTYAMALDGEKQPCRVRCSSAAHALLTGVALPDRARRLAATLFEPIIDSGWGLRTLAMGEARYNPMSYHNGSIWPHDNAIIARGLSRYGFVREAAWVLRAMYDAIEYFDLHRLPELYCGFTRRPDDPPTLYPVACAPQAWAAGAVYMLLEAALGLSLDARAQRVTFTTPVLPEALDHLSIEGLRVGDATVSLRCERHAHDVSVTILRRQGNVSVMRVA